MVVVWRLFRGEEGTCCEGCKGMQGTVEREGR